MTEQIEVLLVDSQSVFRTGLANILGAEADIAVVGEASDGSEAIEKALKLEPHVMLMDIVMPKHDGLQTLEKVKESIPNTKVLIVTESLQEDYVFQALASGADGYLLKSYPSEQFVEVVRKVAAGEVMLSPNITSRLVAELREKTTEPRLSAREVEVLNLLSEGLTNVEIAQRLYVSESTVRTYIYRILEKLKLKNRAEATAYAAHHHLSFARIAERLKDLDIQSVIGSQDMPTSVPEEERQVVEKEHDANAAVESARKLVTAIYVELVVGSCKSESLETNKAEELLHECLDIVVEEIKRYEGTVAWFTGNGIMAFFGVPVSHERTPQRALYSALAIRSRLQEHNEQLKDRGIQLDVRMGVNSGYVTMEKAGDEQTVKYIPVGDTTKLAAKMGETAGPDTILVAENAHRLTRDYFAFEPLVVEKDSAGIYRLFGLGPARSKLEAAMARGLTSFVGRERELDILADCFDRANKGRGQVVGILGEAGVGKSRLLLEFRNRLSEQEHSYLEGSCLYYGDSTPYLPVLRIVRSYFDISEGEQEPSIKRKMGGKIAQLDTSLNDILTSLNELLSLGVDDEDYMKLEPQARRQEVFDAIKYLFIRESQDRPLILAVEDLHWIDRTSEEFLIFLIEGIANARILLILLYRPEYSNPWSSKSYYTQIGLDQLSRESATAMIRATLKGADVELALNNLILSRAGGNPFFLEEIVHYMVESGSIEKWDNQYVLAINTSAIQVPDTVQEVIAERMDRLDAGLKRTVQVSSVIGREFSSCILKLVSGAEKQLSAQLQTLQGREFIYEKSRFPKSEYAFKHALTQDVAYSSLTHKERKELHEKVGGALEELYPDRLEELCETLAHHYSRSENLDKACEYLKASGMKATRNYAGQEAINYYKEMIGLLDREPQNLEIKTGQLEAHLLMVNAFRVLGYPEGCLQAIQESEELARELGDEKSLAISYGSLGWYYASRGDIPSALDYSEKGFRIAESINDVELAVPTSFDLCSAYVPAGQWIKIADLAPKAISLLESVHREREFCGGPFNDNLYSDFLAIYGLALGHTGDFKRGEITCEKGLRFATEIEDPLSIATTEMAYADLLLTKGDGVNAVSHSQRAIEITEESGSHMWLGPRYACLGLANVFQGKTKLGLELIHEGFRIQKNTDASFIISNFYWILGMANIEDGDLYNASVSLQECLRLAQVNNERHSLCIARINLGRILGKEKKPQYKAAEESILQGINELEKLKLKPWYAMGYLFLGELYTDMGQKEKALKNLTSAREMFQEMDMVHFWLPKAQNALDRLA